jgi:gamma-glutamyltranspeptidase/glutathione hydrolase
MTQPPSPAGTARTEVLGSRAAVTSSSPAISLAGARVLADGGNAVDATLAMAAMAWMVLPGQCGIGGDAFCIVREPDGRVWTVNGSGFGPDGGTPAFYRDQGLDALPLTGAQAVAAPGAPAVLATLRSAASRSLAELWAPAVRAARDGLPCTAKNRADVVAHAGDLSGDPHASRVFLPGGRPPQVGERLVQADLASYVEELAADPGSFYTGSFADRAVAFLRDGGAPFTGDEWVASGSAPAAPAIQVGYGDAVLHQTPMPSAGWMVLQQAAICDGRLRDEAQLGATAVHWLASAASRAFRDRFEACGSDTSAWAETLTAVAVDDARRSIAAGMPTHAGGISVQGDTTSTVCVDAEGRAVSFIHSLAFTFGARCVVPGTGVLLNNRLGRGAYLLEGHPNAVQPRRKPLHTLNAWLVDHPDRGLLHVGNCPGGDGQVQWNMQVLSHLVDHGDDPQRAVSLPRFTVFPGSDADVIGQPPELRCEEGLAPETLATLTGWGHTVREVPLQTGGPGGSALAISLDHDNGVLRAAADPRMEGVALAL